MILAEAEDRLGRKSARVPPVGLNSACLAPFPYVETNDWGKSFTQIHQPVGAVLVAVWGEADVHSARFGRQFAAVQGTLAGNYLRIFPGRWLD
jgi:hypothetical protein